jgi:hypothetical protein
MKDFFEFVNGYPLWVKLSLLTLGVAAAILLLFCRSNSSSALNSRSQMKLSNREEIALGLALTEPQAGGRGVWASGLHQDLTRRGFSDVDATAVINSLVRKKLLTLDEISTEDRFSGKMVKIPVYRVTEAGFGYAQETEGFRNFNAQYCYKITLRNPSTDESNRAFLKHLRSLDFVDAQTRFINEADLKQAHIGVFAVQPLEEKVVRTMADLFHASVEEFSVTK